MSKLCPVPLRHLLHGHLGPAGLTPTVQCTLGGIGLGKGPTQTLEAGSGLFKHGRGSSIRKVVYRGMYQQYELWVGTSPWCLTLWDAVQATEDQIRVQEQGQHLTCLRVRAVKNLSLIHI